MKIRPSCGCAGKAYDVIFACSGAADVGAVSDLAARRLSRDKAASMLCTAAIGAGIEDVLEKARQAGKILVIDGCKDECARKVLEKAGFTGVTGLQLGSLGLEKGKTAVDDSVVEMVVMKAGEMPVSSRCC